MPSTSVLPLTTTTFWTGEATSVSIWVMGNRPSDALWIQIPCHAKKSRLGQHSAGIYGNRRPVPVSGRLKRRREGAPANVFTRREFAIERERDHSTYSSRVAANPVSRT